MHRTLREQLAAAFDASDMTIGDLRRRSGIECGEESLSRKLRGLQSLRSLEVEQLASALGIVVAFDGAGSSDETSETRT